MTQIAKVAVAAATYAIDKPYDYLVPSGMELSVGCRVTVPFGRGNRTAEGMVLQLRQEVPAKPLKAIRSLLDQESVLSEKEIRLALWMRQRYFCTFYDALHTILPAAVWYRYREIWSLCPTAGEEGLTEREQAVCRMLSDGPQERETLCTALGEDIPSVLYQMKKKGLVSVETETSRKVKDHMVELASLAAPAQEVLERLERRRRSAPRQYEAAAFLAKCGETTVHDLCYFTGATRQTLRSLEKQGLIALRSREEYRISPREYGVPAEEITLNQQQQSAYDTILRQTETGRAGVTLLQGVTGSGKTLVYIRLAQTLLEQGKSVMILVPEIALTPQMMARFTAYFGRKVALLHSGLRLTERWDQYKRIRRGEATVVLGTRSAVFAPLERLGLIILDEEQESSYESEKAPCYHARDIAKYRCVQEGARLVLGSATPTVETAYYARKGDYGLCRLTERFNQRRLPQVILADMRRELRDGNFSCISRPLRQELERNLAAGEQSILFLNRRGSSRMLLCGECGYVPQCPRCSVPMTYHSANERLMCHYCGHSEAVVDRCSECGGLMKRVGSGTQKVEQELFDLFPKAKVLRMDADTVGASRGHEALLREFEEKNIPILLGTQMVAKGLDFENVTLVGVLDADLSLYAQNYHAAERTYSLLAQVVGRAGRGERPGRAVIQTYHPENEVIQAAAKQDYETFYQNELRMRSLRRYPPFADLFTLTVSGLDELRVIAAARAMCDALRYACSQPPLKDLEVEVLGPAGAPVVKVNNRYRYCVYLCGKGGSVLRRTVSEYLLAFYARKENRGLDIFADCNALQ